MRRVENLRSDHADLLARLPHSDGFVESRWAALIVDPVEQLKELADLYLRGLLSKDEFERQRTKVLGR